jgi:hypothetical protein
MVFIPTEHGALVVARIAYAEEHFTNHLWFRKVDFDLTDMEELVYDVKYSYTNNLLDDFTVSTVFLPFKCYDMRSVEGAVIEDEVGAVPCTGGSKENPPSIACVLTLYTAKRGRAHRGRVYIGPMNEENITNGIWTQSTIDEVEGWGDSIKTEVELDGWEWGVRSGQLDGVPRNPAIITPITSHTVRSARCGTQRRRIDRV